MPVMAAKEKPPLKEAYIKVATQVQESSETSAMDHGAVSDRSQEPSAIIKKQSACNHIAIGNE